LSGLVLTRPPIRRLSVHEPSPIQAPCTPRREEPTESKRATTVFKTDWAALATRSDKVNPSSDLRFCVSTNPVDSPRFPANHGPNTDPRTLLEDGFDSPRHVQFHRIGDRRFWKIADTSQVCIPPSLASVVAPDHLLLFIGAVPGVGLDRNTVVEDADDVSDQRPADYEFDPAPPEQGLN
jgi:hypothetical protein